MQRPSQGYAEGGFTLLEVLIAVAILSISLTSLLTSQMRALRATRYAQGVTTAVFLAEEQLLEIEWEMQQDGWGTADKEFEGDFSEEGWPDITYTCLADMIELPDYTALQQAAEAAGSDGGGVGGGVGVGEDNVQDAGEQAFDTLGMVWPMVKAAIEQSIRKASCKVVWMDGKDEHEFEVQTFWTDPSQLTQLPQMGGEAGEGEDVPGEDGGGPGQQGGQGGNGRGPGGGGPGGSSAPKLNPSALPTPGRSR